MRCLSFAALWVPGVGFDLTQEPDVGMLIFVGVSQAISIAWFVLRFFVRSRNGAWTMIDALPSIRRSYLTSWFAFDLIYVAPIEFLVVHSQNYIFYALQLRHFLRVIRILWLGVTPTNPLVGTRQWFRFLTCFMFMVMTTHFA